MMNVLDALRYRLTPPGTTDLEGEPLDQAVLNMLRGAQQRLPPGLPLVVRDSILNQPSYQEGGQYPLRDFGGEQNLPSDDPRNREYRLNEGIDWGEYMRRNSQQAWPEGNMPSPLEPGQSPFGSPEGPSPGLDYLPGGATRISAGQGLLRGGQSTAPQAMPSPEVLAALAARQRQWQAQQPPGYAEGQVIPGPPNPLMDQELGARDAPQRENDLDANVRWADHLKRFGLWPMPEGAAPPRIGHEQLPPQDPFSSPLNQMLRRPPFGQY